MKKTKYLGYFYLAAAMSLAGSSVVVGKFILHMPVFFAQAVSLVFALTFIIPLALIKEGKIKLAQFCGKDLLLMFLQGLSGVLLFRVFMMLALNYATASSTGLALSTTPAVLAIFSAVFLREKIGAKSAFAIALCFIGVSFINVDFKSLSFDTGQNVILGNLFAFLAVCSEAIFTIFRKKQSYNDKPITSTAIVMFFAFILFLPMGTIQYFSADVKILVNAKDMLYMFIYGAICSSVAYVCWFSGLARVKMSEAAGFTGFIPLSSVTLSAALLQEKITTGHIIGMALVLCGIYIITLKDTKRTKAEDMA